MADEVQRLPPINRYITTHNAEGQAVFSDAFPAEIKSDGMPGIDFHNAYVTSGYPVRLNDDQDFAAYKQHYPTMTALNLPNGSVIRYCDFHPGAPAHMHRTVSIDAGILIEGELECVLDSGETRLLRRGDMLVQRGTMHGWRNPSSTQIARAVFFLQPCEPVVAGGKELGLFVPWGAPPEGDDTNLKAEFEQYMAKKEGGAQ
jgi:quercetin dioxygenase-like cupin family protein